jgi:gluconolactonase
VYVAAEDALYFTTLPRALDGPEPGTPRVEIKRLALDGDGYLFVCEQGTRSDPAQISRVDPTTGRAETVVDGLRGLALNSPNDIVVKSDGTLWFTDPSYGHLQGFKPPPEVGDYLYSYDRESDRLTVLADDFDKPNGLAFSADERVLYVTDSGANQEHGSYYVARPHHIRAFDVIDGWRLSPGRLFAVTTPGFPDGIKVDDAGRVYASSFAGVQVFSDKGELIGEINLPGAVNFAFGGKGRNVLFITTDTAIWAAVLNATGSRLPATKQIKGA